MTILRPLMVLGVAAGAFAVARSRGGTVLAVERVSRVVADLPAAEAFYRDGLGFHRVDTGTLDPAVAGLLGAPGLGAEWVRLRLGREEIALVQWALPGQPYPPGSTAKDLWFQHLAITVSDMAAAHARVMAQPGAQAITEGGPQQLPASSGGVQAFKFRDPDGHPLELLWFPSGKGRDGQGAGPCLGIDHTALATTGRSAGFFRRLGLRVVSRTDNRGPAQSRLDGLGQAKVRVTGMRPRSATGAGIELLAYDPPGRASVGFGMRGRPNDIANDWTTLRVASLDGGTRLADGRRGKLVMDPAGHRLLLVCA